MRIENNAQYARLVSSSECKWKGRLKVHDGQHYNIKSMHNSELRQWDVLVIIYKVETQQKIN